MERRIKKSDSVLLEAAVAVTSRYVLADLTFPKNVSMEVKQLHWRNLCRDALMAIEERVQGPEQKQAVASLIYIGDMARAHRGTIPNGADKERVSE